MNLKHNNSSFYDNMGSKMYIKSYSIINLHLSISGMKEDCQKLWTTLQAVKIPELITSTKNGYNGAVCVAVMQEVDVTNRTCSGLEFMYIMPFNCSTSSPPIRPI